jgi:5-formyltetrahydrofolate cyclo-ligase
MGIDVAAFKRAERSRLRAARQAVGAEVHAGWSAALTVHLAEHLAKAVPSMLGFYWPHRREYDPLPAIERLIERGAELALPVVVARGQPLEYRRWRPGAAMTTGAYSFDIPHPAEGQAVIPDTILVPLLGFDRHGYRLGYGGGYFDRTLAAYPVRPKTVGIGFELGRLETIHPQPHDVPMDVIVTEAGLFLTG